MSLPIIGPIVDLVNTAVDKIFPDATKAAEVKAQIQTSLINADLTPIIESAKIITAEAEGGWLQRNWRPILMLTCVFIVANNYIFYPYIILFGGKAIILDLPDKLWNLMTLGVGGYVAGRSAEKIATAVSGKGLLERIFSGKEKGVESK